MHAPRDAAPTTPARSPQLHVHETRAAHSRTVTRTEATQHSWARSPEAAAYQHASPSHARARQRLGKAAMRKVRDPDQANHAPSGHAQLPEQGSARPKVAQHDKPQIGLVTRSLHPREFWVWRTYVRFRPLRPGRPGGRAWKSRSTTGRRSASDSSARRAAWPATTSRTGPWHASWISARMSEPAAGRARR